jgi:hypothetical protein
MIGAAIVLAGLAAMYWGACYFFRSCRGNKAFRTEYRVTTDGNELRERDKSNFGAR